MGDLRASLKEFLNPTKEETFCFRIYYFTKKYSAS